MFTNQNQIMYSYQSLLSKIQSSSNIDFGDLFNESVSMFKKVWVQGLILQLLSGLIILPLIVSFYSPYYKLAFKANSNGIVDSSAYGQELVDAYSVSAVLWLYLFLIIASLLSYVLYLGFYRTIRQIDQGQAFVFSELFYFFKAASIRKSLGLALTYVLISAISALLCFIPLLYTIVPLMFLFPVFAYNFELSISEIVKVSFALGKKKWGITFVTLFLNGMLIYVVSLLTLGLGALFVSCFLYLPQYIIYKKIIGFDIAKANVQSIEI